jgi:hypothetical protein
MGRRSRLKEKNRNIRDMRNHFRKQRHGNDWREIRWAIVGILLFIVFLFFSRNSRFFNRELPVMWIFVVPGLLFVFFSLWNLFQQMRALHWPSTNCTILVKDIESTHIRHNTSWHALVYYSYTVDKTTYTSNRIRLGLLGSSDFHKVYDRMIKYRQGNVVPCYYDPQNPSRSVLENDLSLRWPALVMLYAIFSFVLGWFLSCH